MWYVGESDILFMLYVGESDFKGIWSVEESDIFLVMWYVGESAPKSIKWHLSQLVGEIK